MVKLSCNTFLLLSLSLTLLLEQKYAFTHPKMLHLSRHHISTPSRLVLSVVRTVVASDDNEPEIELKKTEVEDLDRGDEEMSEEQEMELKKEIFDGLRGKSKTVSVKKFIAWEDVQDMMKDGIIDIEDINEAVKEVGADKSGELSFEQFSELLDKFSRDEEMTPEEELELQQELFNELRGKSKTLSVKKFMEWDDITDGLSEGYLSKEFIDTAMKQAGIISKEITFEQFSKVVNTLNEGENDDDNDNNETFDEGKEVKNAASSIDFKGFGATPTAKPNSKSNDNNNNEEEEEEMGEMTEEQEMEIKRNLFNEMRGKSQTVSVRKFMAWEDVQDMMKEGIIDKTDIKEAITAVGADKTGEFTFEQFSELVDVLSEFEAEDEDDNE
eukprot:gene12805-26999_t